MQAGAGGRCCRYTVWGGAGPGGLLDLGKVAAWEGAASSTAWGGSCSRVRGGEGSQFPPGLEEEVALWVPALCRHMELVRVGQRQQLDGVEVHRYEPHPQVLMARRKSFILPPRYSTTPPPATRVTASLPPTAPPMVSSTWRPASLGHLW